MVFSFFFQSLYFIQFFPRFSQEFFSRGRYKLIIIFRNYINNIVDNYFEAIELNVSISQIKLKNVCVYNVVPPIQKYNTHENQEYPYLGTDEERKQYVLYFNKKLKEKCIEHKYIFFDVYHNYTDENGFLRKDLSDDNVHIGNGIYISDYIKQNL